MNKINLSKKWEEEIRPLIIEDIKRWNPRVYQNLKDAEITAHLIDSTYLFGKVGTGKTHTSFRMLLEWSKWNKINRTYGKNYGYVNVSQLIDELKDAFSKENNTTSSKILRYYRTVDLLILDDIGTQMGTEWTYEVLYLLLTYRYDHLLPTIYSSNMSIRELAKKFKDDRIPNRIAHECKGRIILFKGKSYRN